MCRRVEERPMKTLKSRQGEVSHFSESVIRGLLNFHVMVLSVEAIDQTERQTIVLKKEIFDSSTQSDR